MIKYILTSPSYTGEIIIGFGAEDKLVLLEIAAQLDEKQYIWLLTHLPSTRAHLEPVKQAMKAKAVLVPTDTSFDRFWEQYAKKVNRKRCEPLWAKLAVPARVQCLMSLPAYDAYLRRSGGRAKLDPENYLKKASYENNWNSL